METIADYFGEYVFNDAIMQKRLPKETYRQLKETISKGKDLDLSIANVVASVMRDWALEKGATHFTHWFQPMTGITAEKHDAFIAPAGGGRVIMEFSGKELVQGEPDASSFPSGGLRATFEARGYTAWDPTSFAFVKGTTLYIPTAFCSYSGEALDKKTPLLRSMEALNEQAKRILHLFGHDEVSRVMTTVGSEQEYFLVDKEQFLKRPDLVYAGRTLYGARSPKGQELSDHYFGSLRPRVLSYMEDLDKELWKLGVYAKTRHNEVAPSQHELAPVFTQSNVATDQNQLMMELMKKIADKHGLACLLHEKPFDGVNGSGKHNNWSMSTDTGMNLLNPGENASENAQFLTFLSAVIAAVDEYQELLRVSVASAGNDHRLGANEAPPAIISMYLGEELTGILDCLSQDKPTDKKSREEMVLGVHVLPKFPKDSTDRNRTSPFAFTGNKFEFRMLGSSFSVAGPNIVLNTIVADELGRFADRLEKAKDFHAELTRLVKENYLAHKRIIFNGNNYSPEWVKEAARRGLSNLKDTPSALARFLDPKNVEAFKRFHIFTETELKSRQEILVDNYVKTIHIEALTAIDMARQMILPAISKYVGDLAGYVVARHGVSASFACKADTALIERLGGLEDKLYDAVSLLVDETEKAEKRERFEAATYYRDKVIPAMEAARSYADQAELLVSGSYWPMPTYGQLLYTV